MATPVIMPRQGQSVESCIITNMYKTVGDKVRKGDLLFAYETDKASFEEEASSQGTILAIFYALGDEVPVLSNVLVIGNEGESVDQFIPGKESIKEVNKPEPEKASIKEIKTQKNVGTQTSNSISPRAKELAKQKGIDYSTISGSGPGGRIIEMDILSAIESGVRITPLAKKIMEEEGYASPTTGTGLAGAITSRDLITGGTGSNQEFELTPLSNMRKLIANAMHHSIQSSAQLTHHLSADARKLLELRQEIKKQKSERNPGNITINDMVCLATIRTLKKYPRINCHLINEGLKSFRHIHLGIAVDTDRGLMVPTVLNADNLSINELSYQLKSLVDSCRKGNVNPDLLIPESASFTISNLGNYGVEMFTPIINLPQVAILGVNTILLRPKDLGDGTIHFVPHIGLSLTYDHRAIDGGEATRFLKDLAIEIENLELTI